jgi:hypothetical protein
VLVVAHDDRRCRDCGWPRVGRESGFRAPQRPTKLTQVGCTDAICSAGFRMSTGELHERISASHGQRRVEVAYAAYETLLGTGGP